MRVLALCVALLACASFYQGPTLHRGGTLVLSPTVSRQIVRLMARGVHDQIEPAACVSAWRIKPDTVDVDALTVAETDSADSLNIWWHRELCENTEPSFHGHVWRRAVVDYPSEMDLLTAANISRAPFQLLGYRVNDTTFGVKVYGVRP